MQSSRGTFGRVFFQAPQNHPFHQGIDVLHDGRGVRRRPALAHAQQLFHRAGFESSLAGKKFIQHQPQRVDVAFLRDFFSGKLFGRHVRGCTRSNVLLPHFVAQTGQAKIGDAHLAAAVEHYVGGLQVAVKDSMLIRRGHARANLPRNFQRFVRPQAPDAPHQRGQIFAVHVLHGEKRQAVHLADVEYPANVGVRNLPRDAHFAVEARQRRAVFGHRLGQELQRYRLPQLQVVGAIDLAHSAFPGQRHDAITVQQYGAGHKARAARWIGVGRRGKNSRRLAARLARRRILRRARSGGNGMAHRRRRVAIHRRPARRAEGIVVGSFQSARRTNHGESQSIM